MRFFVGLLGRSKLSAAASLKLIISIIMPLFIIGLFIAATIYGGVAGALGLFLVFLFIGALVAER